jgi:uncharacterized protein YciU (UPF0263 family)
MVGKDRDRIRMGQRLIEVADDWDTRVGFHVRVVNRNVSTRIKKE